MSQTIVCVSITAKGMNSLADPNETGYLLDLINAANTMLGSPIMLVVLKVKVMDSIKDYCDSMRSTTALISSFESSLDGISKRPENPRTKKYVSKVQAMSLYQKHISKHKKLLESYKDTIRMLSDIHSRFHEYISGMLEDGLVELSG